MNLFTSPVPHRERSIFDRTLLRTDSPVYVIGAVNMDMSGTPAGPLRPGDSNPGRVMLSPGGVGRNIAENLRLRYEDKVYKTELPTSVKASEAQAHGMSLIKYMSWNHLARAYEALANEVLANEQQ